MVTPIAVLASDEPAGATSGPAPDKKSTANVVLYSQYTLRGLTPTNRKPALQGGFDYTHSSGFYAGFWGSNTSWISDAARGVSAKPGVRFLSRLQGKLCRGLELRRGFLRCQYFGSYPSGLLKPDTDEIYGLIGWKWIAVKLSDTISNKTFGIDNAKNTYYLDLTAAIPLTDQSTLTLYAGKQKYKGENCGESNDSLFTYNDYKAEFAGTFGTGWNSGVGDTDTNAKAARYLVAATGRNIGGTCCGCEMSAGPELLAMKPHRLGPL